MPIDLSLYISKMTTDSFIALSAAFISFCAFGVAIWQGYLARKHNRLSVQPLLHFNIKTADGDFTITLKNTGIGPAIISSFNVKFSGEKIGNNPDEIAINLSEELEIGHLGCYMYFPGKGQAMAVNEEYNILRIPGFEEDDEVKERIFNDILWLEIKVEYKSIYGTKFLVFIPEK